MKAYGVACIQEGAFSQEKREFILETVLLAKDDKRQAARLGEAFAQKEDVERFSLMAAVMIPVVSTAEERTFTFPGK